LLACFLISVAATLCDRNVKVRDELESEAFQAQVTNQGRFDCWSPCLGGGGGSLLFIILDGRDIMMIPTIDNDFSPTESYVVLCPCDKGFRYWRFR
jgi:hypothetical protein